MCWCVFTQRHAVRGRCRLHRGGRVVWFCPVVHVVGRRFASAHGYVGRGASGNRRGIFTGVGGSRCGGGVRPLPPLLRVLLLLLPAVGPLGVHLFFGGGGGGGGGGGVRILQPPRPGAAAVHARPPAGALTLSRGLRDGLTRRPALFYASKNGAGREAGWGWAPRDERGVYTCLCIAAVYRSLIKVLK